MKGMSQYDLAVATNMQKGMISSYEIYQFHPTLESINKLGNVLDINILCKDGYSYFLLHSNNFKDKLIRWRKENNLTKRDASKLIGISERGYAGWENGCIMSVTTYYKVEDKLKKYNLIY